MRPVVSVQFMADANPVGSHRVNREVDDVGDLFVGLAFAGQTHQLEFARRQKLECRVSGRPYVQAEASCGGPTTEPMQSSVDSGQSLGILEFNLKVDRT